MQLIIVLTLLQLSVCSENSDLREMPHPSRMLAVSRESSLKSIRIYVHYSDFFNMGSTEKTAHFKDLVVPLVVHYLASMVKVYRVIGNLPVPNVSSCNGIPMPSSFLSNGIPDADILIMVGTYHAEYVQLCGYVGTLLNPGTMGLYLIPSVADQSFSAQFNHVLHQFIHGLGFMSNLFGLFRDSSGNYHNLGQVKFDRSVRGVTKTLLAFPNLLSIARSIFGCSSLEGVEIESQDTSGLLHWDMRMAFNDIMTNENSYESAATQLTLALLQDSGWYSVDFNKAHIPIFGYQRGCNFINNACVSNGVSQFSEFCDDSAQVTCNLSHTGPGQCNLITHGSDLDSAYRYFSDPKLGGELKYPDYCPVKIGDEDVDCRFTTTEVNPVYGEIVGHKSRCLVSSLTQIGHTAESSRTACYKVKSCSNNSATITVGNDETGYKDLECPFSGGSVSWPEQYSGSVECPDSNILCGEPACVHGCYSSGDCISGDCYCDTGRWGTDCSQNCGQITGCNFNCDTEGNCLNCFDNYYLSDGQCILCTDIPGCSEKCTENGTCEECKSGYFLLVNNCQTCSEINCKDDCDNDGKCYGCLDDYYLENNACKPCTDIEGCLSCNQDGACLSCDQGYYKANDLCSPCTDLAGCNACKENGDCEDCQELYFLSSGVCKLCTSIGNCTDKCDSDGNCTECVDEYYVSEGECKPCTGINGCTSNCDKSGNCTECLEDYYLSEGICKLCTSITGCTENCDSNGKCTECLNTYYLSDGACNLCTSITGCTENCDETGQCTECLDTYYLSDGSCQLCTTIEGCTEKCESDGKCTECLDIYYLSENTCKSCTSITGCTENCDSDGICTECLDSYYLSENICKSCDSIEGCSENCDSDGKCTECLDTHYLSENDCLLCTSITGCTENCDSDGKCTECLDTYFLSDGACNLCTSITGCTENCDSDGKCTECLDTYFLSDGVCNLCTSITGCTENCESDGKCTECLDTYFLSDGACNLCTSITGCTENCNSDGKCTECLDTYFLSDGACNLCTSITGCTENCDSDGKCTECLDTYFLSNDTCNLCTSITGCTENCDSDGKCTECLTTNYLSEGACELCTSLTGCSSNCDTQGACIDCLEIYYNSEGTCHLCTELTGCSEDCSADGKCTTCLDTYYNSDGACLLCTTLTGCTESCDAEGNCTTCLNTYFNSEGTCNLCTDISGCTEKCDSQGQCEECLEDYYKSNGSCLSCTSIDGCLDCDSDGYCLECSSEYYKNSGSCSLCTSITGCTSDCTSEGECSTCLSTYHKAEGCQLCTTIPGCSEDCEQDGYCNTCLDCYENNDGVCEECSTCAAGECCQSDEFAESDQCVKCPSNCLTCTSQDRCIECTDGSGSCCNSLQYFSGSQCVDCPGECNSCDNNGVCTSCKDGQEHCCPDGQYYASPLCEECPEECETCGNDATCTVCKYLGTAPNCCLNGEYWNGNACEKCAEVCLQCTTAGECASCDYSGIAPVCCTDDKIHVDGICLDCSEGLDYQDIDCIPLGYYYQNSNFIEKLEFNEKYTKLMVLFTENPTFVAISQPFNCKFYFMKESLELLGTDPVCQHFSLTKTLEISLGSNFQVRNNDILYLNGLHIQKGDLKIDRNYKPILKTTSGFDYPIPSFTIKGPNEIYSGCTEGNLILSIETASGVVNSDLKYTWSVTPSGLAFSTETIRIPLSELSSDNYFFEVTVTNGLGKSSTESKTVSVHSESTLSLKFDTGSELELDRTISSIKIKSTATNECVVPEKMSYSWKLVSSEVLDFQIVQNKLILKGQNLVPGNEYAFECIGVLGSLTGSAIVTVKATRSPLKCTINHDRRTVSNGLDLELDGSSSYDPDGESLTYEWYCEDQNKNECRAMDNSRLISTENKMLAKFTLEKLTFRAGDTLNFQLFVSTADGRTASDTAVLTVVDAGEADIAEFHYDFKVNVEREMVIQLTVLNGSSIIWTQAEGQTLTPSSPNNMPFITFKEKTMQEGQQYSYLATIQTSTGQTISIYISWTTNRKPTCTGSVYLIDRKESFNKIGINGCFDTDEEDGPVKYSFGIAYSYSFTSVYFSFSNSISLWMVPGDKNIIAKACDQMGSCYESQAVLNVPDHGRLLQDVVLSYEEGKTETDMIPHLVLEFTNAFEITGNDWEYLFNDLLNYMNNLVYIDTTIDEIAATYLIGALDSLLQETGVTKEQMIRGLELYKKILTNVSQKLREDDVQIIISSLSHILNQFSPELDLAVIDLQKTVNRKQIENKLPLSDALEITSEDRNLVSITHRTFGQEINDLFSLNITAFSGPVEMHLQALPFEDSEIVDLEVIVLKGVNSSDLVNIELYKIGYYYNSTLDLFIQENNDALQIDNSKVPMNLTLPYHTTGIKHYGLYEYSNCQWVLNSSVNLVVLDESTIQIQSNLLQAFKISEFAPPSDSKCSSNFISLTLASIPSAILLVLLLSTRVCSIKRRRKGQTVLPQQQDAPENDKPRETRTTRKTEHDVEQDIIYDPNADSANEKVFRLPFKLRCQEHLITFVRYHLLIGQFQKTYTSKEKRIVQLWNSILMNIAISGMLLAVTQDITHDSSQDHQDLLDFLWISFAAAALACFLNAIVELSLLDHESYSKKSRSLLSWSFIMLLFILSVSTIVLMNIQYCENWDLLWTAIALVSIGFDLLVLQSFTSAIKVWLIKQP